MANVGGGTVTPFRPGEPKDVAAFRFVRARELAQEITALVEQVRASADALTALVGDDSHVPPRVAALRNASGALLAEVDQVVRDAKRAGWTVQDHAIMPDAPPQN